MGVLFKILNTGEAQALTVGIRCQHWSEGRRGLQTTPVQALTPGLLDWQERDLERCQRGHSGSSGQQLTQWDESASIFNKLYSCANVYMLNTSLENHACHSLFHSLSILSLLSPLPPFPPFLPLITFPSLSSFLIWKFRFGPTIYS